MEEQSYVILKRPAEMSLTRSLNFGPDDVEGPSVTRVDLPKSAEADLQNDPDIEAFAPELETSLIEPVGKTLADDDSSSDPAWGLEAVGALASSYDGAPVRVAVLDTGIDAQHPAFYGMSLNQRDFTGEGNGDLNGHGTHCAGTIFGRDVGKRIGVARGVQNALIGKVLNKAGRGTTTMALQGLQWAAEQRAHLISMSLGFDFTASVDKLVAKNIPLRAATSEVLEAYRKTLRLFDAYMRYLREQGAIGTSSLVIAATGNESRRDETPAYRIAASMPSSSEGVLAVGALGRGPKGLEVADFSNTLPHVAAPGVGIVSAWPGGTLETLDGTSMACPHVTGVAALWWQALGKNASSENVRARLISHADLSKLPSHCDRIDVGNGCVTAP